jgi:hypothetical protein
MTQKLDFLGGRVIVVQTLLIFLNFFPLLFTLANLYCPFFQFAALSFCSFHFAIEPILEPFILVVLFSSCTIPFGSFISSIPEAF